MKLLYTVISLTIPLQHNIYYKITSQLRIWKNMYFYVKMIIKSFQKQTCVKRTLDQWYGVIIVLFFLEKRP